MSEWMAGDVTGDGVTDYYVDQNADGTPDMIGLDTNTDGYLDTYASYLPGGGVQVQIDANQNGIPELVAQDVNGDSRIDQILPDPNEDGVYTQTIYPDGANLSHLSPSELLAVGGSAGGPVGVGSDPTGILTEHNRQMNEIWLDPPLDSDRDRIPDGPDLDD